MSALFTDTQGAPTLSSCAHLAPECRCYKAGALLSTRHLHWCLGPNSCFVENICWMTQEMEGQAVEWVSLDSSWLLVPLVEMGQLSREAGPGISTHFP